MDDAHVVHAVQGSSYHGQLLTKNVRGTMDSKRVGEITSTSSSLPTLGSFCMYCLRSIPSMYSYTRPKGYSSVEYAPTSDTSARGRKLQM